MLDISGEIGKEIRSVSGKTLVRIKELSRIARYQDKEVSELDVFVYLFSVFVRQREGLFGEQDAQDLQLVCLGTIADIMPLLSENRIIVKQGLASLVAKPRPGLSELLFKLGLAGKRMWAENVSWNLCPVINAAGRMGNPRKALDMILEKDPTRRNALAGELIKMNEERKKIGEESWTIAEPFAAGNMNIYENKLAVAYSNSIPRGVTGIIANRLSSRFKVPALVAYVGETSVVASLRSSRGYDLRFLLEPLADLFFDWGGHNFAAGFSLPLENWQPFLTRLQSAAANINLQDTGDEETLTVDAELPLSYLSPNIYELVDRFEPYGEGNGALTFIVKNMRIDDITLMGKADSRHVKLNLDTGKHKWPAVYWQAGEKVKRDFDLGDQVDLVFKVTRNWFRGNVTPQLVVNDLKRSNVV
jgi:single-stranded-DNA-specific exonuclease